MRAARRGILGLALGARRLRATASRARIAASRSATNGRLRARSHKYFLHSPKAAFAARDACAQFAAQTWQGERVARAHRLVAHATRAQNVPAFATHDAMSGDGRGTDLRNVPNLLESR
ncbi:hypothetical protein [Lysobacter enzymogenes]|uniref:hypothetical protein n=1 Tax=Lysobacter enzymogenes TaxID=69 RepID=UPI0019D30F85|nr:hypothetical protein [Lysobacter enzymogenes]